MIGSINATLESKLVMRATAAFPCAFFQSNVGDCADVVDTRYGGYQSFTCGRAQHNRMAFIYWWGSTVEVIWSWEMNVDLGYRPCVVWLPGYT